MLLGYARIDLDSEISPISRMLIKSVFADWENCNSPTLFLDKPGNTIPFTPLLLQLTHTCLAQADWERASVSLFWCYQTLVTHKDLLAAAHHLLQALDLDYQYHPLLIDRDLQELAKLSLRLNWQPSDLLSTWQAAESNTYLRLQPLTSDLEAKICLAIGIVNIQKKFLLRGLEWLRASWRIQHQNDNLPGLAEVSYQLAIGYHLSHNLSYAAAYYREAQDLFGDLSNQPKVAFCHHGLGKLYIQTGEINRAIAAFEQALNIYWHNTHHPEFNLQILDIQRNLEKISQQPDRWCVKLLLGRIKYYNNKASRQ